MSDLKNAPTCPHCNYEFDAEETWHSTYSEKSRVHTNDDDESTVTCHNDDCKKRFKTRCTYIAMFISEEDED